MSLLLLFTPFYPAPVPTPDPPRPVPNNGGAGSISAFRRGLRRSKPIYLGWRGLRPDEVTAEEIRETAREVRSEQLLTQEIAALKEAATRFADIGRLASAAAELKRALDQQSQRDEDDAIILLTVH